MHREVPPYFSAPRLIAWIAALVVLVMIALGFGQEQRTVYGDAVFVSRPVSMERRA